MSQPKKKTNLAQVLKLVDELSPQERRELKLELDSREPSLTWANANLDDREERERFFKQEEAKAGKRAKRAFEELQAKGIMDKKGRVMKRGLPADMKPNSQCDVGG